MIRLVAWTSYASGAIAAAGIAVLIPMSVSFAAGETEQALAVGRINDVLVMVSYLLAIPSVLALGMLLRPHAPALSGLATLAGFGALMAIVVLHSLLISGVLSFEVESGQVSIALLVLGVWFVVTGVLGGRTGILPRGGRMGLLAATYVGYPIWAFWFARRLLNLSGDPVSIPGARADRYPPAARKERP